MSRPRREKAVYKLVKIKGRRNWYVQWSVPGSRRSQVKSTHIPVESSAEQWLADFKAFKEAPPPSAPITAGAKLSVQGTGTATIDVRVIRAVTPQVVSRAVANRAVLTFQAQTLLSFLDDVLEPKSGSNMGPIQLWAFDVEGETEAELTELLSQLRKELQRLNAALEAAQIDQENLRPTLSELQKVGLKCLQRFGMVAATGTGFIFTAFLGQTLSGANLISMDHLMELIKAMRG